MATRKIQCNEMVIKAPSAAEASDVLNRIIGRGDVDLWVQNGIRIEVSGETAKEPKAKK